MGQRGKFLTQVVGFRGFKVKAVRWENDAGDAITPVSGYEIPASAILVLTLMRRWVPRCGQCMTLVPTRLTHERREARRWDDLPWAGHRTKLEYEPVRVRCPTCGAHATELVAWAESKQRQTRRLQQHLALDAFSMPLSHVATKYGLSWHTIRRAEVSAIDRWERTRPTPALEQVGVDEKWLGRRHKLEHKFITIVSNLATGEPVWIGYGRGEATLAAGLRRSRPSRRQPSCSSRPTCTRPSPPRFAPTPRWRTRPLCTIRFT